MKTILITGGTGFLGSNLIKKLLINNKIILLKRSYSSIIRIKDFINNKNLKFYNLDKINIENIFIKNKINYLIHTATCYGRNNESLEEIIKTNLIFPINLLELSIKYNISQFINIDSNLPNKINYYSISKNQFVTYSKLLLKDNNIKFINLKTEHFYGPGDDNKKFIPYIIESIYNKSEINLTKGDQKRDFIYIDDIINIIELLVNKKINSSFYELEIGTGKTIRIKDLVIYLKNQINKDIKLNFGALEYRKDEPMNTKADIKKILDLGFKNFTDIYKGLDSILKTYK